MRKRAGALVLLMIGALPLSAVAVRGEILVSTSLDRALFNPGKALDIHITAHNTLGEPVTLYFPGDVQAFYVLDDAFFAPQIEIPDPTTRLIPANGSYTWTYRHSWYHYNMSPGSHEVVGHVREYGHSPAMPFSVVPPIFPAESFTVDFDTLPGTNTPVQDDAEYWPFGVRFRSINGANHRPWIRRIGTNQYLWINSTTYPPGFNIVSDLDVPGYRASADVTGPVGIRVTMIAKSSSGLILDSQFSVPITALGQFVPVVVQSATPIAFIEWWPSQQNAGLGVDNVALVIPEPQVAGVFTLILIVRTARRRGAPFPKN